MKEKTIFWLLAIVSFTVVILRAIYVPMFHDEIVTFNHYIKSGILSPFSEYRAANNHLTNSIFSRFFYLLFGDSPLSLRLTNVLFFIPYCYFLFQIGKRLTTKTVKWGFYLACLFSFQFVAFFALSRGYGIALASVMASAYYLGNFIEKVELKTLLFTIIFLLLGLFAFFSLLLFVFISTGIIGYVLWRNRKTISVKKWLGVVGIFIGFFATLGYALFVLFYYKEHGLLWFGFLEGFWHNTVTTLIELIFEPKNYFIVIAALVVLFTSVILIVGRKPFVK